MCRTLKGEHGAYSIYRSEKGVNDVHKAVDHVSSQVSELAKEQSYMKEKIDEINRKVGIYRINLYGL